MDLLTDVRSRDFLHRYAETPMREQYIAAGALCTLSTNSPRILEAARESFLPAEGYPHGQTNLGFSLRVWVDDMDGAQPPWPKPYVRGLDHLVYAGFDSKSSFLADLATRRVIGRVSAAMGQDRGYWRMTIFPMLMTIVSGAAGLLELHASCVARTNDGVLLLGAGKSGKSTLALAMKLAGFRVLSDDRTFCSIHDGRLQAYGLPRPLKIRYDGARWFQELRSQKPMHLQNGEPVFYCDIQRTNPQHRQPCQPKALMLLERCKEETCRFVRMRRSEMESLLEQELLPEDMNAMKQRDAIIDHLLALPSWRVQYGVDPHTVAEQLGRFLPMATA
jgi:hypothetical protein